MGGHMSRGMGRPLPQGVQSRLSGRVAVAAALVLLLNLAGCAVQPLPPPPWDASKREVDPIGVTATARSYLGAPYRPGGSDPRGFDCSGFVQYVYSRHGIGLPRTTSDQLNHGRVLQTSEIGPGDLVFFDVGRKERSLHVGVYLGGRRFIHSPARGGVVREEDLAAKYWAERFIAVRRPW